MLSRTWRQVLVVRPRITESVPLDGGRSLRWPNLSLNIKHLGPDPWPVLILAHRCMEAGGGSRIDSQKWQDLLNIKAKYHCNTLGIPSVLCNWCSPLTASFVYVGTISSLFSTSTGYFCKLSYHCIRLPIKNAQLPQNVLRPAW